MPRIHFIHAAATRFPHTNEALFAIAIWPVLLATACWRTPQIAPLLNAQALGFSMWQFFLAGLGACTISSL